jgi:signal recognition particle subunit SEC65
MDFFKELNNIFEFLFSIRKLEKYLAIDVKFPSKWVIPKSVIENSKVVENESQDADTRFFSFVSEFKEESLSATLKNIKTIIRVNREREDKEKLFKNKVNELKALFDQNNLDALKLLKFEVLKEKTEKDGEFEIDDVVQ